YGQLGRELASLPDGCLVVGWWQSYIIRSKLSPSLLFRLDLNIRTIVGPPSPHVALLLLVFAPDLAFTIRSVPVFNMPLVGIAEHILNLGATPFARFLRHKVHSRVASDEVHPSSSY
ncbi:hypothetical protein U1Q18_028105, partial [Sarracenia purpurea var. burkii]